MDLLFLRDRADPADERGEIARCVGLSGDLRTIDDDVLDGREGEGVGSGDGHDRSVRSFTFHATFCE